MVLGAKPQNWPIRWKPGSNPTQIYRITWCVSPHPTNRCLSRVLQRIKTRPLSPLMEVHLMCNKTEDNTVLCSCWDHSNRAIGSIIGCEEELRDGGYVWWGFVVNTVWLYLLLLVNTR
jgi:hypothetical protein